MVLDLTKQLKIAFTDDDDDDFLLYNEAITSVSANIELIPFRNCAELLQYLKITVPDLIFMDVNLGGMSGIECIKAIRNQVDTNTLPIVVQSTYVSQLTIDECMAAGANYFVKKPESFEALKQAMQKIFCMEWQIYC